MMPVGFGSIGMMWGKPVLQVAVRPYRHTREYLDRSDSFTLSAFSLEYTDDIETLGSFSGKETDKLSKTNLTLKASTSVPSPSYNEADMVIECRKLLHQDISPEGFVDAEFLREQYPTPEEFHRIYYGEILAVHQSHD
jgi:flavin reductase (DIM6/NTAB) family NADH-FMN oxidoreductase RutF